MLEALMLNRSTGLSVKGLAAESRQVELFGPAKVLDKIQNQK
jgi:hypothetical protein